MSDPLDLWPSDIAEGSMTTPSSILKQQASLLGQKTQQIVNAEVKTTPSGDAIVHSFQIVAPALSNYRYDLFRVFHGVSFYPMTFVWNNQNHVLNDETQFLDLLRKVFADNRTKTVIQSILAQAKA